MAPIRPGGGVAVDGGGRRGSLCFAHLVGEHPLVPPASKGETLWMIATTLVPKPASVEA